KNHLHKIIDAPGFLDSTVTSNDIKLLYLGSILIVVVAFSSIFDISNRNKFTIDSSTVTLYTAYPK
ncbi:hypothetical protein, partial [Enterococcus casseliflavus]|uniref:hypothetical protein n=1 Tax=Enterococcus casseliflavus TaxID=37734 RepID=UPI0022DFFABD